jgi:hypothetical protein
MPHVPMTFLYCRKMPGKRCFVCTIEEQSISRDPPASEPELEETVLCARPGDKCLQGRKTWSSHDMFVLLGSVKFGGKDDGLGCCIHPFYLIRETHECMFGNFIADLAVNATSTS